MAISLDESESVQRNDESFEIGDKVYATGRANFGVGHIQEIEFLGVHFGFRAKVESTSLDEPRWYDARNVSHDMPVWAEAYKTEAGCE